MTDILKHFADHIRYSEKARKWAEKSVAYLDAGKYDKAREASEKCKEWLAKAMEIEKKYQRKSPHE